MSNSYSPFLKELLPTAQQLPLMNIRKIQVVTSDISSGREFFSSAMPVLMMPLYGNILKEEQLELFGIALRNDEITN